MTKFCRSFSYLGLLLILGPAGNLSHAQEAKPAEAMTKIVPKSGTFTLADEKGFTLKPKKIELNFRDGRQAQLARFIGISTSPSDTRPFLITDNTCSNYYDGAEIERKIVKLNCRIEMPNIVVGGGYLWTKHPDKRKIGTLMELSSNNASFPLVFSPITMSMADIDVEKLKENASEDDRLLSEGNESLLRKQDTPTIAKIINEYDPISLICNDYRWAPGGLEKSVKSFDLVRITKQSPGPNPETTTNELQDKSDVFGLTFEQSRQAGFRVKLDLKVNQSDNSFFSMKDGIDIAFPQTFGNDADKYLAVALSPVTGRPCQFSLSKMKQERNSNGSRISVKTEELPNLGITPLVITPLTSTDGLESVTRKTKPLRTRGSK